MKAIFLCEQEEDLFRVFSGETYERLRGLFDMEKTVYTKATVIGSPERFSEVEFVFSTWGMPAFTEREIERCFPCLKAVFYAAGSVQGFAREFLHRGVKVFSAWAANAVPVAEMTVAQIVLANKGYFLTSRLYRQSADFSAKAMLADQPGNYGETVGIIGAGMIGRLVIDMLKAYRLNILVFDPFLSDEKAAELGVQKCDLMTLFERSFVVSNHLANNEKTKGMLTADLFSRMRANAVFINTGRGAQVVEEDLARVLRARPDLTALLDVTDPEPPEVDHPFFTLPNCLVTPHIAGSHGGEVARMGEYMLRECEAFLHGTPCRYEVTEAMLATMA